MGDVHAERPPEAPMDPTDPWGALGAHVVAAKGARGARVGGCKCSESPPTNMVERLELHVEPL